MKNPTVRINYNLMTNRKGINGVHRSLTTTFLNVLYELKVTVNMISVGTLIPIEVFLQTVIIKQYLESSYCVTVVSEPPLDVNYLYPFTYIDINGPNFNDRLLEVSEMGCSDYIIRVEKPDFFMATFENVTHFGNARRSDKKLIFIGLEENENNKNNLLDILSMTESSFVANILLILPDNSVTDGCTYYNLVTHKFVGPDEEVSNPIYLDKWDSCTDKFEKNANLFPHDLSNLYGKTVKISCFTYKPYVFLDLDSGITPSGRDGTEIRIVEEFCR